VLTGCQLTPANIWSAISERRRSIIGFPIFDWHHHHRYPIWGYQGTLNVMVWILDRIHLELDRNSMGIGTTDFSYDIIR
jgi:nitrogenase molybdenum-iron protein beta chain